MNKTLLTLAAAVLFIGVSVTAATTLFPTQGGTGLSTAPSYGEVLVGNASGGYTLTATTSLGITGSGGTDSWSFSGGFLAPTSTATRVNVQQASSTVFSALRTDIGATATTTIGRDGWYGHGTTTPSAPLTISRSDSLQRTVLLLNNTGAFSSGEHSIDWYNSGSGGDFTIARQSAAVGAGFAVSSFRTYVADASKNLHERTRIDINGRLHSNFFTATSTTVASVFPLASTTHTSASGQFFAKDGTTDAPGYSFTSDTNTGVDLVSAGILGFIIDGTGRAALSSTQFYPYTNDGAALGTPGNAWSDLAIASGGVVDFGNGDLTATHSTGNLTLSSGDRLTTTYSSTTAITGTYSQFTTGSFGSTTPGANTAFVVGTSTWTGIHVNSSTGKVGVGCENTSPAKGAFDCGTNVNVNPNIKFLVQDAADARMGAAAADIGVFMKSNTGTIGGGIYAYNYALGAGRSLILNEFGGNVGVGTTTPWRGFAVAGTGSWTGLTLNTGAATASLCLSSTNEITRNTDGETCIASSIRFKKNIATLAPALGKLELMRPVAFEYKETPGRHYGFIAEQMAKIDPMLVSVDDEGLPNGIRWSHVTTLLVGALQEISQTNDAQDERLEKLDARISQLEAENTRLRNALLGAE
jgi:hypothetical protein